MAMGIHPEASLLGLPRELRDQVFWEVFSGAGSTIVVECPRLSAAFKRDGISPSRIRTPLRCSNSTDKDSSSSSRAAQNGESRLAKDAVQLLKPLPMHGLLINRQLYDEAKSSLQKYVKTTRVVFNCSMPRLVSFIRLLPDYIKEAVLRVYVTARLLFTYHEHNKNAWTRLKPTALNPEGYTSIGKQVIKNFDHLQELAIYVPVEAVAFYCKEAPREVCRMLELGQISRAQFVFRDPLPKDPTFEKLYHVDRIIRGADAYPDKSEDQTPEKHQKELDTWNTLSTKFVVRREDMSKCLDEFWWAAGDVLAKNYTAEYLKGNGPRAILSLALKPGSRQSPDSPTK